MQSDSGDRKMMSKAEMAQIKRERTKTLKAQLTEDQLSQYEVIPEKFKYQYLKAVTGNSSPQSAIKQKCMDCVCWENYITEIGNCTVKTCPLWHHRPYQD